MSEEALTQTAKGAESLDEKLDRMMPATAVQEDDADVPLEEYVNRFSGRYQKEKTFKKIVHQYLDLNSRFSRIKLNLGKVFRPEWYENKVDDMIQAYAIKIKEDLKVAKQLQEEIDAFEKAENEFKSRQEMLEKVEEEKKVVNTKYKSVEDEEEETRRAAEEEFRQKKIEEERRLKEESERIQSQSTAKDIAKEKLKEHMVASSLIQMDEEGNLAFDEEMIANALEDIFLKEIVEGIESENGTGFMSKLKSTYEGVIAYWSEIDDHEELGNVDWIQSIIYSRTKGYRTPQFPYLIAGKPEGRTRTTIDTAISIDTSTSTTHNERFIVCRKTALATRAVMRKLNPNNHTYLSHYNNKLHEISTADLVKRVKPAGWTRTDKALDWLVEKLKESGPALAYLITDGEPADGKCSAKDMMNKCIRSANKFQEYPNIMLRIFLVDGEKRTEENIRRIGMAAGPNTKVIPIDNYQLGGGVIKDISKCIGGMYDILKY